MQRKLVEVLIKLKRLSPSKMAQYAKGKTDFYQKFYQNYDVTNFKNLPLLTKNHLVGVDPLQLLSKDFIDNVSLYGETSGSSGSPTPCFFTARDFKNLIGLCALTPYTPLIEQTLKENRVTVNGLTFGYTIAGFSFTQILLRYRALVAQLGSRSTIATPERNARTIAKLKPSIIAATPLDLMAWLEIIRTDLPESYQGVRRNLKILFSTAEPCANTRKQQLEKHFGIVHINTYATVDGFITIPCPCGEKHIINSLYEIELFDHNLKSLGFYGTGRLCFTNLLRKTSPLVKYLIDDYVTITPSTCPHGFKNSVFPKGRYELTVDLNNRTWGSLDFEELIYKFGLPMDYRVFIRDEIIQVELEEYPSCPIYDSISLKTELAALTGLTVEVKLLKLGNLTSLRKVRENKSIIKILDLRKNSRQILPKIL
jgi:phenylacetate-CoA ligase